MTDDNHIDDALDAALHRYGVTVTSTRLPFIDDLANHLVNADAVILDVGIHRRGAAEVCREVRAASMVPIIVVSASAQISDRVRALSSGADDYLTKPYDVHELMARIHSKCRPRPLSSSAVKGRGDTVTVGDVVIDLCCHSVTANQFSVHLTRKEFTVLALLARSAGVVCTRRLIVTEVWGRTWSGADSTLDVHVAGIRAKLGRTLVQTVRGFGYRLNVGAYDIPPMSPHGHNMS